MTAASMSHAATPSARGSLTCPHGAKLQADLRNIAMGVNSLLWGFMFQHDFHKLITDMPLESGAAWTLPIVLDVGVDTAGGLVLSDRVGFIAAEEALAVVHNAQIMYRFEPEKTIHVVFQIIEPIKQNNVLSGFTNNYDI